VIAIIGMLAGLMLPAVQQAREAGRRAECINNQRNVALALLNYEGARQSFPGFRQKAGDIEGASWYCVIFPYIEQTNLYEQLQGTNQNTFAGALGAVTNMNGYANHAIGVFKCSSSGRRENADVDYVANCGPTNVSSPNSYSAGGVTWTFQEKVLPDPPKVKDDTAAGNIAEFERGGYSAVFFNKSWASSPATRSIGLEYITSKNGTSNTLLVSENINAGRWIDDTEREIGFCYPNIYYSLRAPLDNNPYTIIVATRTDIFEPVETSSSRAGEYLQVGYPYWINAGKTGALLDCYRGSRPSSNHPGIVAAAFCDGSVRPISDSMDKATFRDAMNPTSGRAFAANAFN
ncbi:MAG: DUF1559 domain-containing protein, partial [Culicoidibacterales bacterium]